MSDRPRVVNIVATGQFQGSFDFEEVMETLDCFEKVYEPEIYPGLLFKVTERRFHVTLYANGKYIICGVKNDEELMVVYNEVKIQLEKYLKKGK